MYVYASDVVLKTWWSMIIHGVFAHQASGNPDDVGFGNVC
jgi:hypothetical protein